MLSHSQLSHVKQPLFCVTSLLPETNSPLTPYGEDSFLEALHYPQHNFQGKALLHLRGLFHPQHCPVVPWVDINFNGAVQISMCCGEPASHPPSPTVKSTSVETQTSSGPTCFQNGKLFLHPGQCLRLLLKCLMVIKGFSPHTDYTSSHRSLITQLLHLWLSQRYTSATIQTLSGISISCRTQMGRLNSYP